MFDCHTSVYCDCRRMYEMCSENVKVHSWSMYKDDFAFYTKQNIKYEEKS